MDQIKLIIEAGGSKSHFGLIDNKQIAVFNTRGFNPNSSSTNELICIIEELKQISEKKYKIQSVLYYGAGCGNELNRQLVHETLSDYFRTTSQLKVCSDLEGAAIALFGQKKGIAAILGTGAWSGYYNGEKIEMTSPSLGYLLGDEGSGTYLGKELIKRVLRKELEASLIANFQEYFKLTNEQLIKDIYSNKAQNAYLAGFVPFLSSNINHPAIEQMLSGAFLLFYEKYIKPLTYNGHIQTIGIVGGIAFQFQDLLQSTINRQYQHNFIILKDAFSVLIKHSGSAE